MNRIFFRIEFFCNIINVITVTFDQYNASLLKKNVKSVINLSDHKLLNSSYITEMLSQSKMSFFIHERERKRTNKANSVVAS